MISNFICAAFLANSPQTTKIDSWTSYGGNQGAQRYSPLVQITRDNVQRLDIAYEINPRGTEPIDPKVEGVSFETTPILAENKLIWTDSYNRIYATEPGSGKIVWQTDYSYDGPVSYVYANRGATYWQGREGKPSLVFIGTLGGELRAYRVSDGTPYTNFGNRGVVDLKKGLGHVVPAEVFISSPPIVTDRLVISGTGIWDNRRVDSPSGAVRAYDIHSGRQVWAWDPVPPSYVDKAKTEWLGRKDGKEYGDFARGTPNSWGPATFDSKNNLIFLPMGNPGGDYFRGNSRPGIDYYGTSVVALNASTGKVAWRFKLVENDVWDYDLGHGPSFYDAPTPTGTKPALVVSSKMGFVYMLDRLTGEPISETEFRRVSTDGVPGEQLAQHQLFPVKPAPLHPSEVTFDHLPLAQRLIFRSLHRRSMNSTGTEHEGIFTPPRRTNGKRTPVLHYPGVFGGNNWGGVSVDPIRNIAIINTTQLGFRLELMTRNEFEALTDRDLKRQIVAPEPMTGMPYAVQRTPDLIQLLQFNFRGKDYRLPLPVPATPPPYGRITAINLNNFETLWSHPLGKQGPIRGVPNIGGSLITKSGLVFIGATVDKMFRALDINTGEVIWETQLKYGGMATPMTFESNGKQYIAIADGGNNMQGKDTPRGHRLVVYELP